MDDLIIEQVEGGVIFDAKIVPASSRTKISGPLDGMIKIKISAAPEKGKANRCLIDFLGKHLGVKKTDITIIAGETNQVKKLRILGVSAETVKNKLIANKQDRS